LVLQLKILSPAISYRNKSEQTYSSNQLRSGIAAMVQKATIYYSFVIVEEHQILIQNKYEQQVFELFLFVLL